MSTITSQSNINPFLAFLTEKAQEKNMSLEDFCQSLGYSLKMLDALAGYRWLKPSNLTFAALAKALGQTLYELRETLRARLEEKTARVSNSELGEMVNLYELMPASERRHLMEDVRRRAEQFFDSQPAQAEPDYAGNLAEIQQFYASLPPRARQELVQLLRRINIHYQELVKDDQDRQLGFINQIGLDEIL